MVWSDPFQSYRDYEKAAFAAADKGDWDKAIQYAKLVPPELDIWQQFPSHADVDGNGPGLPDGAIKSILAHLTSTPKNREHLLPQFLFELAGHLPEAATSETLNRIAELGKEDYYVEQAIKEHPNYRPDDRMARMQAIAKFWHEYERSVTGDHFATIRSLFTGQPENFTDHRGNAGSSEKYKDLIPHFWEYGREAQAAVAKTAAEDKATNYDGGNGDYSALQMRWIKGAPHIKVYRGVGGNFGESIRRSIRLNEATGEADHKRLVVPHPGHFSSWTANPEMATRFAHLRGEIDGQPKGKGLVIEKWLPLKNLLHSGFHTLVFDQDHAHHDENELIFAHPDGKLSFSTKDLRYVNPQQTPGVYPKAMPIEIRTPEARRIRKSEGSVVLSEDMEPEERRLAVILDEMKAK
jgi:hypothetical protein